MSNCQSQTFQFAAICQASSKKIFYYYRLIVFFILHVTVAHQSENLFQDLLGTNRSYFTSDFETLVQYLLAPSFVISFKVHSLVPKLELHSETSAQVS